MSDLNLTIFCASISFIALSGAYLELLDGRKEGQRLVKPGQGLEPQPVEVEFRRAA